MSQKKLYLKTIAVIIFIAMAYIFLTYLSKQAIFTYYKWHDKKHNWLKEYQFEQIKDKYKLVLIVPPIKYISDREASNRIILACKNLGWEVFTFESIEGNEEAIRKINPDFIFSGKWDLKIGLKNNYTDYHVYALLPLPTTMYFGGFFKLTPRFNAQRFPQLVNLDGFIIASEHPSIIKNYVENNGKKFHGFKGYFSVPFTKYKEIEPNRLVYMGINWDSDRSSKKYAKLFKTLSETENVVFYGSKAKLEPYVNDSFKEHFKDSETVVLDILQENGINLILHNKDNIKSGVPSGRAFETAAASIIGISDRHPFILENFGETFLYIDVDASSARIANQIHKHLLWIKNNPEKAKAKAKKAHQIFIDKFTMESQLINLAKMHEKIKKEDNLN